MGYQTPTLEPTTVRAGDTWRWTRALADYPAPTWTLTYTLFAATGVISVSSVADGAAHRVDLTPAVTAAYDAGRYDWVAHVSNGTDRHQIGSGVLRVLPDLASAASYDGRSHARKVLEALDALIERRATAGDVDLVSAALGDKTLSRSLPELLKLRDRYVVLVAQEDAAAALARGNGASATFGGQMVQVRFRG